MRVDFCVSHHMHEWHKRDRSIVWRRERIISCFTCFQSYFVRIQRPLLTLIQFQKPQFLCIFRKWPFLSGASGFFFYNLSWNTTRRLITDNHNEGLKLVQPFNTDSCLKSNLTGLCKKRIKGLFQSMQGRRFCFHRIFFFKKEIKAGSQ